MTTQSDIKKLAEQMASSMNSFDDIKDFQKQLMQSFIDTALEAEMEDHLGYPKHEKADKPNKRNGHTKRRINLISSTGTLKRESAVTQAILKSPPQETVMVLLSLSEEIAKHCFARAQDKSCARVGAQASNPY